MANQHHTKHQLPALLHLPHDTTRLNAEYILQEIVLAKGDALEIDGFENPKLVDYRRVMRDALVQGCMGNPDGLTPCDIEGESFNLPSISGNTDNLKRVLEQVYIRREEFARFAFRAFNVWLIIDPAEPDSILPAVAAPDKNAPQPDIPPLPEAAVLAPTSSFVHKITETRKGPLDEVIEKVIITAGGLDIPIPAIWAVLHAMARQENRMPPLLGSVGGDIKYQGTNGICLLAYAAFYDRIYRRKQKNGCASSR